MTAGLQPGDLIIVAGRPSMGKTTLALNIAENAAISANTPVAVFSMEMSREQLSMRMISSLGRVDQSHLRTGNLRRRGLGAHQRRHRADEDRAALHRRQRRAHADRGARARAAPAARERAGSA